MSSALAGENIQVWRTDIIIRMHRQTDVHTDNGEPIPMYEHAYAGVAIIFKT